MDETERQALQEAEDERLARELVEKEKQRLLAAVSGVKSCVLTWRSDFCMHV